MKLGTKLKFSKAMDNLKHKCILVLIYSAGLRLGERIHLRVDDMNISQKNVFVKAGKGKKTAVLYFLIK